MSVPGVTRAVRFGDSPVIRAATSTPGKASLAVRERLLGVDQHAPGRDHRLRLVIHPAVREVRPRAERDVPPGPREGRSRSRSPRAVPTSRSIHVSAFGKRTTSGSIASTRPKRSPSTVGSSPASRRVRPPSVTVPPLDPVGPDRVAVEREVHHDEVLRQRHREPLLARSRAGQEVVLGEVSLVPADVDVVALRSVVRLPEDRGGHVLAGVDTPARAARRGWSGP